jgi:hypothetical protein
VRVAKAVANNLVFRKKNEMPKYGDALKINEPSAPLRFIIKKKKTAENPEKTRRKQRKRCVLSASAVVL